MLHPSDAPTTFSSLSQGRVLGYEAHYEFSERLDSPQYHCHDYYEFYLHLRGGQYMGVDDRLFQLKPNQVFIFPPFYMHGLSSAWELHDYERAYICLSGEVLSVLGCGQLDLDRFFRSHAAEGRYTFQLSASQAADFVRITRQLQEQAGEAADAPARFQNYSLLIGILSILCRTVSASDPERSGDAANSFIRKVLAYINVHYTEELSVPALARHFNVSPSYLSHEFSRFTNRSPYDYILYRRIMLSRQLMTENETLSAIAFRCGFNDYSNFLRSFMKIVGVSPSRYRKEQFRPRASGPEKSGSAPAKRINGKES